MKSWQEKAMPLNPGVKKNIRVHLKHTELKCTLTNLIFVILGNQIRHGSNQV